jgi:hypothetical protein
LRVTTEMQIVGISLVRDEDVFVGRAVRNVAAFCDRIYLVDHRSRDGTWEIAQELEREIPHLHAVRARHSRVSHEVLEPYARTDTWVFGVDGDELYDPAGLVHFREQLLAGAHRDVFRLRSNVLNVTELDRRQQRAVGFLSPPSRAITKLFNFAAVDSWTDCPERLHHGTVLYRPGYHERSVEHLGERLAWEESPLRCLHVCFLRRSSLEPESAALPASRPNLEEHRQYRRSVLGRVARLLRRQPPPPSRSSWKDDRYRRGPAVTKDAAPFLGAP